MSDASQRDTEVAKVQLTAHVKAHGCAAKLSPGDLGQLTSIFKSKIPEALLAGIDNFEDAAVYKLTPDLAIVQTVDFFPAVVDDPYLFGQIAAANAISDIYAMGAKPLLALNILSFPTCDFPISAIEEILKGGQAIVESAGAVIAGGHSIKGPEPVYGLAVTGIINPNNILANNGAKAGDHIVISKAIGTGVGLNALKANLLSNAAKEKLIANLITLNKKSLEIGLHFPIHALTDVTGFALIGHLGEMAKASKLQAHLHANKIPLLPEVRQMAELGMVPAATYTNKENYKDIAIYKDVIDQWLDDLLFDPQTSGGLLFALDEINAMALCKKLTDEGVDAAVIGYFSQGIEGAVEISINA